MSEHLKLLSLLADGKPHSGEELARLLGVEQKTVPNLLGIIAEIGVDCTDGEGQGYCWTDPVELLESNAITSYLGATAGSLLSSLAVLGEIDSTNRFLMDAARDGAPGGYACVAEYQSRGQGRRGRGFVSPIGNIYLSVLWRFVQDASFLSGLSVAIGVVVAEVCQRLGVTEAGVKWPNDVLWQGRKLSGILVETQTDPMAGVAVVVGVGLNFRMAKEPGASIGQSWVDIQSAAQCLPNRNEAVGCLLEAILLGLEEFSSHGFTPFKSRWNQNDVMKGRPVVLRGNDDSIEGLANGVDEIGALLLDVDGVTRSVMTGDLSLRLQE